MKRFYKESKSEIKQKYFFVFGWGWVDDGRLLVGGGWLE